MQNNKNPSRGLEVTFRCRGHHNIRGLHKKTFEFTRAIEISSRATCILGVAADYKIRQVAQLRGPLEIHLRVNDLEDTVTAYATPFMKKMDSLVIRCSDQRHGHTFAYGADKGARQIDRRLVMALAAADAELEVTLKEKRNTHGTQDGACIVLAAQDHDIEAVFPALEGVIMTSRGRRSDGSDIAQGIPRLSCRNMGDTDGILRRLQRGQRLGILLEPGDLTSSSALQVLVSSVIDQGIPITARGFVHPKDRALVCSGFPVEPCIHLPEMRRRIDLEKALQTFSYHAATMIWPQPAKRLVASLERLHTVAPDRHLVIAQDPGGRREQFFRGIPQEILSDFNENAMRVDLCWVVLAPPATSDSVVTDRSKLPMDDFIEALLAENIPLKALVRSLERFGYGSRRHLYRELLAKRKTLQSTAAGESDENSTR